MKQKRPIHRGISDFALWALVQSNGTAILADRKVVLFKATPVPSKGPGYFEVLVSDVGTVPTYVIDVTTMEHEEQRQAITRAQTRRRQEKKRRDMFA